MFKRYLPALALGLAAGLLISSGPAIARSVVDFARNAHRVDGFHAVGARAGLQRRAGKLVATNKNGYLPAGIIRRGQDSERLGGVSADQYVQNCESGSVSGTAFVPLDVGGEWIQVVGFGTLPRLPNGCFRVTPMARRISTGVYQVRASTTFVPQQCSGDSSAISRPISTVTIAEKSEALQAQYGAGCDEEGRLVTEVRIFDLGGQPTDASFSFVEHGLGGPYE